MIRWQRHLIVHLGPRVPSPAARWTQYALTVAGVSPPSSGTTPSQLYNNGGIRIVDNTTLHIADKGNHRVVVVQPGSTTAVAIIGSGLGTASDQFNQTTDLVVTGTSMYVLDAGNYRVQMWPRNGSNGTTVAGIAGFAGTSLSTFGYSYGIQVDNYGNLYVSDSPNHRVLRFPSGSVSGTNSVLVAGIGTAGAGPSQLNGPFRIFVDVNQSLYVADTYNHRIQFWSYGACSGVTVAGTGVLGTTNTQLYYPVSVMVDANQIMYISDQLNNRIHRWAVGDCSGQCLVGCTQTYGPAAHQLYYIQNMAFDSEGAMLVSDGGNHRVQKFALISDRGESSR